MTPSCVTDRGEIVWVTPLRPMTADFSLDRPLPPIPREFEKVLMPCGCVWTRKMGVHMLHLEWRWRSCPTHAEIALFVHLLAVVDFFSALETWPPTLDSLRRALGHLETTFVSDVVMKEACRAV